MDDKHREILRRQQLNLRRDLEVMKLLPKLHSVLDTDDEEEVKAEATRRKKVDKLLNILPKKGPKAFDVFVKGLQEIQPFLAAPLLRYSGKEEMKTCCRKHSFKLKDKAHTVTKDRQQKETMESRVQFLETTVKRLEKELSIEKSQKEDLLEETARLNKMCDEMKEDIRIVKKILEERTRPVEILSDSSDNALSESTCEDRTPCYSRQGEFIVVDRIPNVLDREKCLEGPENFSFPDTATSPERLNEFKFEGNQTCLRCGHRLEEEHYPQNKIHQLELKIKILENEKRHKEMEIAKLREENERLKACEPFGAQVNKLEQHVDNFSRELENINRKLVNAARRNSF